MGKVWCFLYFQSRFFYSFVVSQTTTAAVPDRLIECSPWASYDRTGKWLIDCSIDWLMLTVRFCWVTTVTFFICRLYTMSNIYEFNNTIINRPLIITGCQAFNLPLCFHVFSFDELQIQHQCWRCHILIFHWLLTHSYTMKLFLSWAFCSFLFGFMSPTKPLLCPWNGFAVNHGTVLWGG